MDISSPPGPIIDEARAAGAVSRGEEIARDPNAAPSYVVPSRRFGAVEVPMVVLNLDRAERAFGRVPNFSEMLDPNRNSLQLYLNPDSPFLPPILSHNAATHNVVLKVTVPKRTGRRRKKGTKGPWEEGPVEKSGPEGCTENHRSHGRLDHPRTLRRRLADNVERYEVEAVGVVGHTHRYKGMADFSWEASHSEFTERFSRQILTGEVSKIKNFTFTPGLDRTTNCDIIPPPVFTHLTLPFNYNYEQNPYVRAVRDEDGGERVMNITAAVMVGHFVKPTVEKVPTAPRIPPDLTDATTAELMGELEEAFDERPIWTRRSLLNRLGNKIESWNVLKKYISYTAYQFKGGPFKDAVIRYGVDPRLDPKYRIYQTMFFKLPFVPHAANQKTWHAIRKGQQLVHVSNSTTSHIFDGTTFYSNGKLWQVCDITDPFLSAMFSRGTVRESCDITGSGWYHQGLWAKAKAVMKCKLLAIRFNRHIEPSEFEMVHSTRDETPEPGTYFSIKVPPLNLTEEELAILRGNRYKNSKRGPLVEKGVRRVKMVVEEATSLEGVNGRASRGGDGMVVDGDSEVDGEGEGEDNGEEYDEEDYDVDEAEDYDEDGEGEDDEEEDEEEDDDAIADQSIDPRLFDVLPSDIDM